MLSALMLLMHRSNIVRLWQGTEQKSVSERAKGFRVANVPSLFYLTA